ncbi:MAG: TIGR03668 family PPOX class F420-dependent oxidoreductase [Acidimicrobiia bacterium]
MDRAEALSRLGAARVGHLVTTRPNGQPHVVPVVYALVGNSVVTMIDHKPKTTDRLQRLINIENNPVATLMSDHYSEDWTALWWVRVDGEASVHIGDQVWEESAAALSAKYGQYAENSPRGPAVVISLDKVTSWESTP